MKKYNANENMVKWMNGIGNMKLGKQEDSGEFTKEESKLYDESILNMFKPTGINLFDEKPKDKVLEFSLQGSLFTGNKEVTLDELTEAFIDMCETKGWEFCGVTSFLDNKNNM